MNQKKIKKIITFLHKKMGVAIGFLLPPMLVRNHDDIALIGKDLQLMFYIVAGFTSILLVLVLFCKLNLKNYTFLIQY